MDERWLAVFGRDVLVNVLANLIAAAVIYLGAVIGGYLGAQPVLVTVALVIVAASILTALLWIRREHRISYLADRYARPGLLTDEENAEIRRAVRDRVGWFRR